MPPGTVPFQHCAAPSMAALVFWVKFFLLRLALSCTAQRHQSSLCLTFFAGGNTGNNSLAYRTHRLRGDLPERRTSFRSRCLVSEDLGRGPQGPCAALRSLPRGISRRVCSDSTRLASSFGPDCPESQAFAGPQIPLPSVEFLAELIFACQLHPRAALQEPA